MAEVREVHTVKSESGGKSGATPWLAFIVGALLVAVVAVFLLNGNAHITGPGGQKIDLSAKSPISIPAPAR